MKTPLEGQKLTLDNNQLNPHKWQPTLLGEFLYFLFLF